jgi:hypothetical protein
MIRSNKIAAARSPKEQRGWLELIRDRIVVDWRSGHGGLWTIRRTSPSAAGWGRLTTWSLFGEEGLK